MVHPAWTHAKQPHETSASSTNFGRGSKKTASKRRRDYRSKKQIQEVHHSGSLTETSSQHQPGPAAPVHGYSAVATDPSSSDSLEQPSTTSGGGGSGASDASSSCELGAEVRLGPDVHRSRGLGRDYSIDARTDALFHEFVKYDPHLSGGQRRSVSVGRPSEQAGAGDEASRMAIDGCRVQHRADHHRFTVGQMRTSIDEEDESLEV